MRFEIYKSGTTLLSQVWRWRLVSSNERTIADGAEGYTSKSDCQHGIDLMKGTHSLTPAVDV